MNVFLDVLNTLLKLFNFLNDDIRGSTFYTKPNFILFSSLKTNLSIGFKSCVVLVAKKRRLRAAAPPSLTRALTGNLASLA